MAISLELLYAEPAFLEEDGAWWFKHPSIGSFGRQGPFKTEAAAKHGCEQMVASLEANAARLFAATKDPFH